MKIHVDIGRGLEKCPRLSTRGGEGVKNRQNLVHVVIEWPLSKVLLIGLQNLGCLGSIFWHLCVGIQGDP